MQKYLLLPFCLYLSCLPCVSHSKNPDIQNLNINARSVGLGQSLAAGPADFAASGNPASLGQEDRFTLSLSQARLTYDRYGYQILQTIPLVGALALRFDQVIIQNTTYYRLLYNPDGTPIIDPITNQQAQELAYDTRYDTLFALAYGLELLPGLALGLEGEAVHLKLGEDFAWGYDGNLGIIYKQNSGNLKEKDTDKGNPRITQITRISKNQEQRSFGIMIKNLNRQWRAWRRPYREEMGSMEIEAGVRWPVPAWNLGLSASIAHRLKPNDQPVGRVGVEYSGFSPLELRAGWDKDHLNLGVGFYWEAISVDYAVITSGALYDANRITVKIEF